ncbi:CaiB/BaiF CoA transferase family protein [Chachezhania sediminis]|uniref:CaiB/BaiF CoA transferase family protein n=1 Tax=Chachezhania sediminis TaxID=2599291 RepID=UPI00131BAEA8|nr:CaiB/BaiF CoA-transferase family protein [Chachezhania sediminis]
MLTGKRQGPLTDLKVVEMVGVGPGPFCGMMLADMGADVVRVDRLDRKGNSTRQDVLNRSRRSVAVDLKSNTGVGIAKRLIAGADVLIEGFRPSVMERLGLGPQVCHGLNPALVYGRITGWGQDGPLAQTSGHDINYIALTGALQTIGTKDAPVPPLNLVGDFGGGGMLLAFGVLAAVHEARVSGKGQVVDAAMMDGAALLMSMIYGYHAKGRWTDERQANIFDGGAHFYGTYECADGKFVGVGAIEPQFYALMLQLMDIDPGTFADQWNETEWPRFREELSRVFRTKTRDEWDAIFAGTDACVSPVLSMGEVTAHPHNAARQIFTNVAGTVMPSPAPRFSRTPGAISAPPVLGGEQGAEVLADWGFAPDEIAELEQSGAI